MEILVLGLLAVMMGALRAALSLVFEHPLDVMKTWWQANPHQTSFKLVARDIYQNKGLLGFYRGAIPNLIRVASKQAYRYPMMLFIPCIYALILNSPLSISISTAITIALLEVSVITPLERIKVWVITSKVRKNLLQAFFKSKPELYRGTSVVAARQIVAWGTFLPIQDQLILWSGGLDFKMVILISIIVGGINSLCVLPLDCIKTNLQKCDSQKNAKYIVQEIYKTSGIKGFYAGWMPRVIQYMINAMFTVSFLESLRKAIS